MQENTAPVESVDRALRALDLLAAAGPEGAALADLALALDLHKTTVHRSLAALRHRGYVAQDPVTGRYQLGGAAVALADRFLAEDDLPARLRAALIEVCAATDELVHLGVLSGVQVVYLDKVEPERAVRVWSAVGRRNWAATTALGRAMLSQRDLPRATADGYARAVEPPAAVDPDHLWTELSAARERGWAQETQENEPGIACLAVPLLRGPGRPVAAISVTAPAERLSAERMAAVSRQLTTILPPLLPAGVHLPTPPA